MPRKELEFISHKEANELVGEIVPFVAGDPSNDTVAFALMQIIDRMATCDADARETNACIFQQAIFPHTDAFCRSLDYFAENGRAPLAAYPNGVKGGAA